MRIIFRTLSFIFLFVTGLTLLTGTAHANSLPLRAISLNVNLIEGNKTGLTQVQEILESRTLGNFWTSPIKYAIRQALASGVPANTIVLLLLLPAVALIIAASRHIIGLRGFGIFLPAALAVVFVAIGPIVGIGLFLVIITVSTLIRLGLRRFKVKLQYLPRMAMILWFVVLSVLGVVFLSPVIKFSSFADVSVFAILILALLAEDFVRVQIGKSVRTAVSLTSETLILSLLSYLFLTWKPVQEFALLNPEVLLISVFVLDIVLGRYVGLRLMELWRFRKLIKN